MFFTVYIIYVTRDTTFFKPIMAAANDITVNPRPRRRGRKRAPCIVLDAAGIEHYDAEVQNTHKRARADKTLGVYASYWRGITEWYGIHKPEWCTDDVPPRMNVPEIRNICSTTNGLKVMARVFKRFLQSRRHATDLDNHGNPAIARVGTLSGYRTT